MLWPRRRSADRAEDAGASPVRERPSLRADLMAVRAGQVYRSTDYPDLAAAVLADARRQGITGWFTYPMIDEMVTSYAEHAGLDLETVDLGQLRQSIKVQPGITASKPTRVKVDDRFAELRALQRLRLRREAAHDIAAAGGAATPQMITARADEALGRWLDGKHWLVHIAADARERTSRGGQEPEEAEIAPAGPRARTRAGPGPPRNLRDGGGVDAQAGPESRRAEVRPDAGLRRAA